MRLISILILALCASAAGAQTYKWVDERGVTTYGTKPPAGRPAQLVDHPVGTIQTNDAQLRRYQAELKRRAEARPAAAAPVYSAPAEQARGMQFDTYLRLQQGMSEGELLSRAGRPDHVSLGNLQGYPAKSFYYHPTTADPFITVVAVRGGRIANIERIRKF
jgi:hypothetical protein